jgi:hypothetical protein
MLDLSIVDAAAAGGIEDEPGGVCVRCWTGETGAVRARAYVGPVWNSIVWDGIGTFRFRPDTSTIEVLPASGTAPEKVRDLYRRHILPLVMQANGCEAIHASAVMVGQSVVGFCGPGGVGKSTVAYALSRRGFPQYADDVLVMKAAQGSVEAVSLPFLPRLRVPTAQFFGTGLVRNLASESESHAPRHPLAALFVLERAANGPAHARIRRCSSAEALTSLLPHAQKFDPTTPASRNRFLQNYLEIAAVVPVLTVKFSSTFDRFDELLDQLTEAVGVECSELCEVR